MTIVCASGEVGCARLTVGVGGWVRGLIWMVVGGDVVSVSCVVRSAVMTLDTRPLLAIDAKPVLHRNGRATTI